MAQRIRWVVFIVILAILALPGMIAVSDTRAQSTSAPRKSQSVSTEARSSSEDPSQLAALQADAKKMRVLLDQMRTNLAFVATSATPLKHQFELEIDMWQMQLDQMDRRIAEKEHRAATGR
jgi:hypothetical protein